MIPTKLAKLIEVLQIIKEQTGPDADILVSVDNVYYDIVEPLWSNGPIRPKVTIYAER